MTLKFLVCLYIIAMGVSCTELSQDADKFGAFEETRKTELSSSNLPSNLKACPIGFFENTQGVCERCSFNCNSCSGTSDTCTGCNIGFYLLATSKTCQSCSFGCKQCSSDLSCSQCYQRFFYRGESCISCVANCESCSTETNCLVCRQGYKKQSLNEQDYCVLNKANYEYFGILVYAIGSALAIWLLIETVKRSKLYTSDSYLIRFSKRSYTANVSPDNNVTSTDWQRATEHNLNRLGELEGRLSI